MSHEITGILESVADTFTVGARALPKRTFRILVPSRSRDQLIELALLGDRVKLIDQFASRSRITCHFDIEGSEWKGRCFINLNCWKIVSAEESGDNRPPPHEEDDIPF